MTTTKMIQKLRDKFGEQGLRSAVELHTNYNKWQVEDLTVNELIKLYQRFFPQKSPVEKVFEREKEQKVKKLRSVVLKDATYIGLLRIDDWRDFNNWMLKLSPLKKPLNAYKLEEFEPLIKQFKSLKTKYDKKAMIPGTKEWYYKNKIPMPSEN